MLLLQSELNISKELALDHYRFRTVEFYGGVEADWARRLLSHRPDVDLSDDKTFIGMAPRKFWKSRQICALIDFIRRAEPQGRGQGRRKRKEASPAEPPLADPEPLLPSGPLCTANTILGSQWENNSCALDVVVATTVAYLGRKRASGAAGGEAIWQELVPLPELRGFLQSAGWIPVIKEMMGGSGYPNQDAVNLLRDSLLRHMRERGYGGFQVGRYTSNGELHCNHPSCVVLIKMAHIATVWNALLAVNPGVPGERYRRCRILIEGK